MQSDYESTLTNDQLKFAAARGFAVNVDSFRHARSRISADGRKIWFNRLASEDAIHSCCARNRDISYRLYCSMEAVMLGDE